MRGDLVIEAEHAFLDQHHQGDGGDRLAHGVDAEDRILPHGLAAFEIHLAGHADMGDVTTAIDHGE